MNTILPNLFHYCWIVSKFSPICRRHSEQQLVDCDQIDGSCTGGWYTDAWDYLIAAKGSTKQSFYPYTGVVSLPQIVLLEIKECGYKRSATEETFFEFLKFVARHLQILPRVCLYDRSQGVHVRIRPIQQCDGHANCPAEVRASGCSHRSGQSLLLLFVRDYFIAYVV